MTKYSFCDLHDVYASRKEYKRSESKTKKVNIHYSVQLDIPFDYE